MGGRVRGVSGGLESTWETALVEQVRLGENLMVQMAEDGETETLRKRQEQWTRDPGNEVGGGNCTGGRARERGLKMAAFGSLEDGE